MTLVNLTKLPAIVLAWENLQEVFVMLVVVVVFCFLLHWRVLHFPATFPCHRHSTLASQAREGLHQPWVLPWLLLVALLFPGFSVTVLPRALRFWVSVFYPQTFFTLCFFTDIFGTFLWLRCGKEHPIQDLPLCMPSQSCPFRLTNIVVTRPLIYQLRKWAMKNRVKIKLLNMFCLFKVISKDYKNTLNKTW